MKCSNCGVEIPASWKAALAKNICPACDGNIMNEEQQEVLQDIKNALEKMPNDPEGLAGWFVSNYHMRKIGDGKVVDKFHGKPKSSRNIDGDLKLPDKDPLERFMKNAGVKQSRREQLEQIANDYTSDDDEEPEELETESGLPSEVEYPEYTKAMLDAMEKEDPKTVRRKIRSASKKNPNLDTDRLFDKKITGEVYGSNLSDVTNKRRMQRLVAQEQLATTGSVGKIKRSE